MNIYLILSDTQVAESSRFAFLIESLCIVFHWVTSAPRDLVRTAVETSRAARTHAMEARLSKQPMPSQHLHTTAGLTAAKNTLTNDNTVFISAQCRIKTASAKDQKNTDPTYGQWGKPWPKDTYMSGVSFPLFLTSSCLNFLKRFLMNI